MVGVLQFEQAKMYEANDACTPAVIAHSKLRVGVRPILRPVVLLCEAALRL